MPMGDRIESLAMQPGIRGIATLSLLLASFTLYKDGFNLNSLSFLMISPFVAFLIMVGIVAISKSKKGER